MQVDDVRGGPETPRQLDLGFGMYEMCPFPLSFMHACDTSDQCKQTGCCAMHAFPGTRRWQKPCCVVSRLVTLARLTGSCIKSKTTTPESGTQQAGSLLAGLLAEESRTLSREPSGI